MKKAFLSVLLLVTITSVSTAQGFHLGAKAGFNLGKIKGQPFEDGFKLGYQVGGFAEIDFTKGFGIQPELLWSQTNTKVTDEVFSNVKPGEDVHLNYLNVPLLLRLNPSKLLTINVGPQFSILTNKSETVWQNTKDAFKGGDFSMVAGAQVNLGSLRVYGRYNVGLNRLNAITDTDKWKQQTFQFGLGLKVL